MGYSSTTMSWVSQQQYGSKRSRARNLDGFHFICSQDEQKTRWEEKSRGGKCMFVMQSWDARTFLHVVRHHRSHHKSLCANIIQIEIVNANEWLILISDRLYTDWVAKTRLSPMAFQHCFVLIFEIRKTVLFWISIFYNRFEKCHSLHCQPRNKS